MKARVAIARALAMQPKILLMDELFAALDALTRRKMQEELLRLWEEVRFTLLFVTHSIEEALVVGNRILLLSPHPGRVRAEVHGHPFGLHSLGGEPRCKPRRDASTACCSTRAANRRRPRPSTSPISGWPIEQRNRSMSRVTRVREEYEVQLEPLLEVSLERRLP